MTAPRYMPLIGYPRGWSPATPGRITGQPIMLGDKSAEELRAYAGRLGGAIVMTQPVRTAFITADRPAASGDFRNPQPVRTPEVQAAQRAATQELNAMIQRERPGLILEQSGGEHGTVFVLGMSRRDAADTVPTVVLAAEHYNLIARMLDQGLPVTLSVQVDARVYDADRNAYNVIAELKGADPKIGDDVVMVGAHLDSWHTATGATDNADGVAVAMEAMRILKAIGAQPRRTIRVALWGGEEQGLLGSREYVQRHLQGAANRAAFDRFSVYFNLDNGFVPIYGFYLQGNQAMQPIMREWLAPFADLGATVTTLTNIGSTDHLSFHNAGLPGFQAVHDYTGYDTRTHHTNMDTAERLDVTQLKQASVVMASVLYHAAMRDAKIPRPQPAAAR
jgi:carboxypeptidase Q